MPEVSIICVIILRSIQNARRSFYWASVSMATASLACCRERNGSRELNKEGGRRPAAGRKTRETRGGGARSKGQQIQKEREAGGRWEYRNR